MNGSKGGLGIGAVIVIIMGVLCATGVFGGTGGILGSILHIVGIACIVIGILVVLLLALVIFAAFRSKPKDENHDSKMEINGIIQSREKELAKLKSTVSITKMELRKAETKLKESRTEAEKANYAEICANYRRVIEDTEKRILEIDSDILLMKQRRDHAFSQLSEADYIKNDEEVMEKLEEKAQYEQDYAEAYKSLK